MATLTLDELTWAEEQFGDCQLGDTRRTRRAVMYAAQVAADPNGSTPQQTEAWKACKGAYRLFGAKQVTFQSLATPHWQRTRARESGTWLLISDTTELDFGMHRHVPGLKPNGNGHGLGFLLHSSLMVSADGAEIAGLAGQVIRYRQPSKKETSGAQRLKREDRESAIWGQLVDQIGQAPQGVNFIHVFDRGGDHFEAYCHLRQNHVGWVVRAAQKHRKIITPVGKRMALAQYTATLPVAGTYELTVQANRNQPARTATVEVRFGAIQFPRPRHVSVWAKETGISEIPMGVVEVREVLPPKGVEALHWILLTSESVDTFEMSWTVIGYYERRPLIEEFHKGIKTGCHVEERLYQSAKRLEAVTAMLSVVAVRLLQLRSVARHEPDRAAEEVVPKKWIRMLQAVRKVKPGTSWTVRQFYRELAKLGGFLGRKRDGEPGWMTLWRGLKKLTLMVRGAEALKRKCG